MSVPKTIAFVALCLAPIPPTFSVDIKQVELRRYTADDSAFWNPQPVAVLQAEKLLLAPGAPIVLHSPTNSLPTIATIAPQPRLGVFALNISGGDPEWLRVARDWLPAALPPLVPVNWQALPTTFTSNVITAVATNLVPGTYRLRLAVANAADPLPVGAGVRGDWYAVVSDSPHSLDLTTEQCRHVYYRGETIPATMLVRTTGELVEQQAKVQVMRMDGSESRPYPEVGTLLRSVRSVQPGTVRIPALSATTRRLPFSIVTRDLAPGHYVISVTAFAQTAVWPIEIVDPIGPSVITISENEMQLPFADAILSAAFGWPGPDALAHGLAQPHADLHLTTFRNQILMGVARRFNQRLADTLDAVHAGPAPERVGLYDLRQLWMDDLTRLRIGFWAGTQSRGLSFTKANTLPGTEDAMRQTLLSVSRDYRAWANYLGPEVDMDCALVAGGAQLAYSGAPDNLTKAFQQSVRDAQSVAVRAQLPDALASAGTNAMALREVWGDWLRGVWPRTDARDRAALALLSPTLLRTANREFHHGGMRSGQNPPDLCRELDVQHIEAWGDALDSVLFPDAWANLGAAARRANRQPHQPLWVETQSYFHDTAGNMQTRWWGALANGADGVGYAANVFGLRGWSGIEPHRANYRRQTAAAMGAAVRTLGPLLRVLERERRVAILLSKSEADRRETDWRYGVHCHSGNPPFASFAALTLAGYQPDFILDENILQGDLERYPVLYLTFHQTELTAALRAKVDEFSERGGKVVVDADCRPGLVAGAIRVDVRGGLYQAAAHLAQAVDWKWIDESVPKLRATLDPLMAPLPGRVTHPRCVTYWLRGGEAWYALVINEGYEPLQTTLQTTATMHGYDLLTGQAIGATTSIPVDLRNHYARLYVFAPTAVSLAVQATTKATAGEPVGIAATLQDDAGKTINAIAPAIFRICDASGRMRWERWTPIGPGMPAAVWDTAATEDAGAYTGSVTELWSGRTAMFPIVLRTGKSGAWLAPSEIGAVDRRTLGTLWQKKGAEWSVVLQTNQAQLAGLADELVAGLQRKGMRARIWREPETIPMPVGFLFTPEQQHARNRVVAGEVIGARYFLHTNDAPNLPTWEPRTGTAIYRNVVLFEKLPTPDPPFDKLRVFDSQEGIRMGVREFSGDHDAVHLCGADEPALRRLVREALAVRPNDERYGPEAGRTELARGYLLGGPVNARREPRLAPVRPTFSVSPVTWAEQIGRPIDKIDVSPNGRHILVTHDGYFNVVGQFDLDGRPVRTTVREAHGDASDDVRGVTDQGEILVQQDASQLLPLGLDGRTGEVQAVTLWRSPDGQDEIRYQTDAVEEKDAHGQPKTAAKRRLLRRHGATTVFDSAELGSVPGGFWVSPTGEHLFQFADDQPRDAALSRRYVRMYAGQTGKLLWEKKGWLVYPGRTPAGMAWSANGEFLAVVRNYPTADYHGLWPELNRRCQLSIVRAADGEVIVEGSPTTWVDKLLLSADGRLAVGVPAFVADHYWLLEAGRGLRNVKAGDAWLYDVALDTARREVFTLDLAGNLRRHRPTGEVLWSQALRTPAGPCLGILKPFGEDLLLGTSTGRLSRHSGRDGRRLWERTTTDGLAGR